MILIVALMGFSYLNGMLLRVARQAVSQVPKNMRMFSAGKDEVQKIALYQELRRINDKIDTLKKMMLYDQLAEEAVLLQTHMRVALEEKERLLKKIRGTK